jgi:serine phosphatase RsbU (regulator of sigma subunit)
MLTVWDVADSSVRAAVVAATTRAALRAAAHQSLAPSDALAHSCELLCPEMQAGKGLTCLYSVLDPSNGRFEFANAGYSLAYYLGAADVGEVNRSGQPLGLAPRTQYEQYEVTIKPGECLLLVTDGLVAAGNSQGEPFGGLRLQAILEKQPSCGRAVVDAVLSELQALTGAGWQQEDDITLIVLERSAESLSA